MKSTPYSDSSYSPNESCEASNVPDCGACADEGMIDNQIYCDCPEGEKQINIACSEMDDVCNRPDLYHGNYFGGAC